MPKTPTLYFEPVLSSQIREIAFAEETIYVKFKQGKVYSYEPCSKEMYDEFKNAESVGGYFHKNLKTNSKLKIKKT